MRYDLDREQGAVVVQAAAAMLVLMGFGVFVVDYGILWISRQQAQHAADAGAMAAAVARAYDVDDAPSVSGVVGLSASQLVSANPVWFAPAAPDISFACPPEISTGRCVRVDVYRNGTFGSAPLPTVFGPVLGIDQDDYGVRATATAHVGSGNATTCVKPWAIPDKWIEHRPIDSSWSADDEFDKYDETGPGAGTLLMPHDDYFSPDESGPGSGVTLAGELGLELTLSFANPQARPAISPGFLLPLVLPGANSYEQNIADCNGQVVAVGDYLATGTNGMHSATTDGFAALIASDPGASWNATTNTIDSSCAPTCAPVSPRLVVVAVFDVDLYQSMRATEWACPGIVGGCVKVVNLVGFFLDYLVGGSDAVGYLARHPGLRSPDHATLSATSSFLPAITLVR
jgi:hypothetical protein